LGSDDEPHTTWKEAQPTVVHGHEPQMIVDQTDASSADLGAFIEEQLKLHPTELYTAVLERVERYLFTRVLQETNGNQSQAAEILGVTRGKIRDRIATFNISMERKVRAENKLGD